MRSKHIKAMKASPILVRLDLIILFILPLYYSALAEFLGDKIRAKQHENADN